MFSECCTVCILYEYQFVSISCTPSPRVAASGLTSLPTPLPMDAPQYLCHVSWTNKAVCTSSLHSLHVWGMEKPHATLLLENVPLHVRCAVGMTTASRGMYWAWRSSHLASHSERQNSYIFICGAA